MAPQLLEPGGQALGFRCLGHVGLVVVARFLGVEGCGQIEDRSTVLDRDHAPRREGTAVANPVDGVEHRDLRVAGAQEVTVQRVWQEPVHGPAGGHQRLRQYLAAEQAVDLPALVLAPEDVEVDLLEIEQLAELVEAVSHAIALAHASCSTRSYDASPSDGGSR